MFPSDGRKVSFVIRVHSTVLTPVLDVQPTNFHNFT